MVTVAVYFASGLDIGEPVVLDRTIVDRASKRCRFSLDVFIDSRLRDRLCDAAFRRNRAVGPR